MPNEVLKSFTIVTRAGEKMYASIIIMKTPSISTTSTKYGEVKMLFLVSPGDIFTHGIPFYSFSANPGH